MSEYRRFVTRRRMRALGYALLALLSVVLTAALIEAFIHISGRLP